MRVGMYYKNSDVRLEEMPQPAIGDKEVLVRIEASGICGSDVMEWYRKDKIPLVLGHEVAGVIARAGVKVKGFKAGDRAVVTHHVPCEKCEYCRSGHETVCETLRKTHFDPGGFCEYVRVPAMNVEKGMFRLPKNVSFEEGTFAEPLGCVVRGQRLAGVKKGKRVLVIGSGLSGLLHIKLARALGAKSIIAVDVDNYRLVMAKKFGANKAIVAGEDIPARVLEVNGGRLADVVIICASAQSAIAAGLKSVERGGVVLFFSAAQKDSYLPVSTNNIFWRSEVMLLSSYAASPSDLKEALHLIAKRKVVVSEMITHRLGLNEIQRGFDLTVRPDHSLKIIIKPQR